MKHATPHMHEAPDMDENFLVGPPQQGQITLVERTGSLNLANDDVGMSIEAQQSETPLFITGQTLATR
jgi:hypothetical protein